MTDPMHDPTQGRPEGSATPSPDETRREAVYVEIANRAQEITGRSIWPSTVKAVLEVAAALPAAAPDERAFEDRAMHQRTALTNPSPLLLRVRQHVRDHGGDGKAFDYAVNDHVRAALATRPAPVVSGEVELRRAVEPCATLLYAIDDDLIGYEDPGDIDISAVRDAIQSVAMCFKAALGLTVADEGPCDLVSDCGESGQFYSQRCERARGHSGAHEDGDGFTWPVADEGRAGA